jgi:diacylglycerol kinase
MTHGKGNNPQRFARLVSSFGHAFDGWRILMHGTPNARIHAAIAAAAIVVGAWLQISLIEWAVLCVTIGMVFTAEMFNTALETLVDLASPEIHPLARASKDVAAGGVLFAAVCAGIVGLLIFGPPLWVRLASILNSGH